VRCESKQVPRRTPNKGKTTELVWFYSLQMLPEGKSVHKDPVLIMRVKSGSVAYQLMGEGVEEDDLRI